MTKAVHDGLLSSAVSNQYIDMLEPVVGFMYKKVADGIKIDHPAASHCSN